MNMDMVKSLLQNMDPEDTAELAQEIDISKWIQQLAPVLDNELTPHFEDIRDDAQKSDDISSQQYYESLSDGEKQEIFDETIADLVVVLRQCREQPGEGFPKLKSRLRDPDVLEPLLLFFEDDGIDKETEQEMKDFARTTLAWAGTNVIPEAYTQQEKQSVESRLSGK